VQEFKDIIAQACPEGRSMILDSEVLMMDVNGHILPFGSLGIHKKDGYNGARPCLFVFDILEYNGQSMLVSAGWRGDP
jgi:DNA ligase-3